MSDFAPISIIPQPPIPTMRIVAPDVDGGVAIINRADFDPNTMVDADAVPAKSDGAATLPPIKQLADAIALLDAEAVQAMQARDERPSAAPIYTARLAALAAS